MVEVPPSLGGLVYAEFLDTEWFYDSPKLEEQPSDFKLMSTSAIMDLAQPSRVREILLKDRQILNDLHSSVARSGILTPLIVKIDKRGQVTLFDGHHRIIVATERAIPAVPVVFEKCQSLSLECKHISDVIHALVA